MAATLGWRRFGAAMAGTGLALGALTANSKTVRMQESIPPALSPQEFREFELQEVEKISHNTSLFRFKLEKGQLLGMTVASCLVTQAPGPDGKPVIRPYTPTTGADVAGHFDLVVKRYDNGIMSKHIHNLKPGEKLAFKGPFKKIDITPNMKREIGMVCGGTGITPMYQVIHELLKHPEDKTKLTLVFANVSVSDILLKDELDALAKKHPRFTVHYVVDKGPEGWKGFEGRINRDVLEKTMPKPGDDAMVFVCGPPPMMNAISGDKNPDKSQGELSGLLKDMGYQQSQVYKF